MASNKDSPTNSATQPPAARVGKYLMLDILGEGAFGKVRLAVDQTDGQQYAMKIMEKSHIKANELTLQVRREIAVMKAMRHPNIVNLREVLTSSKNLYMVMDLVTGGELFDAVAEAGKLPEQRARLYFQQLVDGIHYCHTRRVYHRDLKPENLLLTGDKQVIKITDFGLSSIKATNASSELLHTIMGSPHYIAPEIITSAAEGYDGSKVDVWASGIILFGMLAGFLPFDEPNNHDLYRSIVYNPIPFPPYFSYDASKVIRDMLQKDPQKRPTMADIKNYPWFKVNYTPLQPEDSETTQQRKSKSRSKSKRHSDKHSSRHKKKGSSMSLRATDDLDASENDPISATSSGNINTQYVNHHDSKSSRRSLEEVSPNRENGHPVHVTASKSYGSPAALGTEQFSNAPLNGSNSSNQMESTHHDASPRTRDNDDSVDCLDGIRCGIDAMEMANAFTYVETPSNTKLQGKNAFPFGDNAQKSNSLSLASTSRSGMNASQEDDTSSGLVNKWDERAHPPSQQTKLSVGLPESTGSWKAGAKKELTPTGDGETRAQHMNISIHTKKENDSVFISPVSVNSEKAFDRSKIASPKSFENEETQKSEVKETGIEGEGETDMNPQGGGIFKPVKALFKPLTKTLELHQEQVSQPEVENPLLESTDVKTEAENQNTPAWNKNNWVIDSGDVFADIETEGEQALRKSMSPDFPPSTIGPSSMGSRISDRSRIVDDSGSQSEKCKGTKGNVSSIFGSLSSELVFKLAPSQE